MTLGALELYLYDHETTAYKRVGIENLKILKYLHDEGISVKAPHWDYFVMGYDPSPDIFKEALEAMSKGEIEVIDIFENGENQPDIQNMIKVTKNLPENVLKLSSPIVSEAMEWCTNDQLMYLTSLINNRGLYETGCLFNRDTNTLDVGFTYPEVSLDIIIAFQTLLRAVQKYTNEQFKRKGTNTNDHSNHN